MERGLIKEMCMENIQPQSMIWFKSMVYVKFLAKQENTEMVQVNRQTILNVVLRIYVALAIFQPHRDLEAGDKQSLKS